MITSQDAAVQIKLVIMYAIGVITMLTILGTLIHKQGKVFSKFSVPIIGITAFMSLILIDVITLP